MSSHWGSGSRRWLITVLALGAALRLFAIWFGLPYTLARPDEDVATAKAMALLSSGDLNPHFFHWPSLTFYLFGAIYSLAGLIQSMWSAPASIGLNEQLLIGRTVVALAGTATLFVLFHVGQRVADEETGVLAAGLLAVATLHVRESHFAMTDVLMTLFLMVSLLLLLRAIDETDHRAALRWFAASGVAGGLAASTKYSGAAIVAALLPIFVARTAASFTSGHAWLPLLSFGACFACAFAITSPYVILDFKAFLEGFGFTVSHLAAGQNVNVGRGWTYHLTHSLPFGAGVPTFVASLAGVVIMLRRHRQHALVIGTFAGIFFMLIGSGYLVFFRYVLPLLPLVSLAAAIGIRHGVNWLVNHTVMNRRAAITVLITLVAGPSLVNSIWFDVVLARTDTRVIAAEWLASRLQSAETFYDSGGKYVALDLGGTSSRRVSFDAGTGQFVGIDNGPDWLVLYESPLFSYTGAPQPVLDLAKAHYVLAISVDGTPLNPSGAIYDVQDLFFMPVWGPWTVKRPGPTVRIYRRHGAG